MNEEYEWRSHRSVLDIISNGIGDLRSGFSLWPVWTRVAWADIRRETRRTLVGIWWYPLSLGLTVLALGYVFGGLMNIPSYDMYPHLAAGLGLWGLITGSIVNGANVFISRAGVIQERALPLSFHVYRLMFRIVLETVMKLSVFGAAVILVGRPITWLMLYAIPGFFALAIIGTCVAFILSIFGTRFRDTIQFLPPVMLLAFLLSPVLWRPTDLPNNSFLTLYNPFAHALAVVRDPLMGQLPSSLTVFFISGMVLVGLVCSVVAFSFLKDKVVFWV